MAQPLTSSDAAHLLRRVGFGGTTGEINALVGLSRADAIDRVLDIGAAPSIAPLPPFDPSSQWAQYVEVVYWWINRMVTTPTPVQEKLTLFWHGHFTSAHNKVQSMLHMFGQNLTLRAGALGNFGDLCKAVAVDSAMLEYLDNARNVSGVVNENFARELMELFTLGVGNYTQADVVAMARAWTGHNTVGWSNNGYDYSYVFNANRHDTTSKTLFGISRAWNGPETIDEIVNGSKRLACARFIARKLVRFLAFGDPSDATVQVHADAFAASNMSIRTLVRSILLSDEFWAPSTRYARVKSPTEFAVDLLRRTGVPARSSGLAEWALAPMGQELFNPPNVSGWGQDDYWLSTSTAWARGAWLWYMRWQASSRGFLAGVENRSLSDAVQTMFDALGILEPSIVTRTRLEVWFAQSVQQDAWALPANALAVGALTSDFQLA